MAIATEAVGGDEQLGQQHLGGLARSGLGPVRYLGTSMPSRILRARLVGGVDHEIAGAIPLARHAFSPSASASSARLASLQSPTS